MKPQPNCNTRSWPTSAWMCVQLSFYQGLKIYPPLAAKDCLFGSCLVNLDGAHRINGILALFNNGASFIVWVGKRQGQLKAFILVVS